MSHLIFLQTDMQTAIRNYGALNLNKAGSRTQGFINTAMENGKKLRTLHQHSSHHVIEAIESSYSVKDPEDS